MIVDLVTGVILYANDAAVRKLGIPLPVAPDHRLAEYFDWDPQPLFSAMTGGEIRQCEATCQIRATGEFLKVKVQAIQHGSSLIGFVFVMCQHGYDSSSVDAGAFSKVILIGTADPYLIATDATMMLQNNGSFHPESVLGTSLIDWVSHGQVDRLESWAETAASLNADKASAILVNLVPPWNTRRAMVVARATVGPGFFFTILGLDTATAGFETPSRRGHHDVPLPDDAIPALPRQSLSPLAGRLAPRELEVIAELANGHRVPSIARRLFLSAGTVRNHLSSAYRKLGVKGQQELLDLLRNPQNEKGWPS